MNQPIVPASPSCIHVDIIGSNININVNSVSNEMMLETSVTLIAMLANFCTPQLGGIIPSNAIALDLIEQIKVRMPATLHRLANTPQQQRPPG